MTVLLWVVMRDEPGGGFVVGAAFLLTGVTVDFFGAEVLLGGMTDGFLGVGVIDGWK